MVVLSNPNLLFSTNNVVTTPYITLTFEGVVYGLYTVLFALCIYIVESSAHPVSHLKLYTPALVPLYILATIGFALSVANAVQTSALYMDIIQGIIQGDIMTSVFDRGRKSILLRYEVHSNLSVAIYRTYFIWGSKRRVVIAPALVSLVSNGSLPTVCVRD
ncbi:hypothetical protein L218DRAFT_882298 [Marasmius fiardii PR-910]|nr:hypothetical protein L218DRAFT_882298 [Marasmius fiardii PR-910]